MIDMTCHDRIRAIDLDTGVVDVEAGVSLASVMRSVVPLGYWVPVLPGTRYVTVGGAIASDIHGKNHHSSGSFGNHVVSIDIMYADGTIETLLPTGPNADVFWATIGGMGLTGIILRAKIRLKATESAFFLVDQERTRSLEETMERLTDGSDESYEYSVAVPDTISTDHRLGRAIFSRGSLARVDDLPEKLRQRALVFKPKQRLSLPEWFPGGVANHRTFRVASSVFHRIQREQTSAIQSLTRFYHPLDLVGHWNRAYGRNGFLQYQFSVPYGAEDQMALIIERIARSGHRSFLNVFKRMGDSNRAPLSWPHPGLMLSLDFLPTRNLDPFLDSLDDAVVEAGGRLYFAKDSRMKPHHVPTMYPRLSEWKAIRTRVDPDGVFSSDLARRLELVP